MKLFTTIVAIDKPLSATQKDHEPTTFDIEKVHPAVRKMAAEWGHGQAPYMGIDKTVLQALGFRDTEEPVETDPIKLRYIRDSAYHEMVKAEKKLISIVRRRYGADAIYWKPPATESDDPAILAARAILLVAKIDFHSALEACRKYPCKPVDKHTDPV